MKSLLKASVGVLALTTGAGIAMAQTDTGTTAGAGAMPPDITCAQIVDLDSQQAEQRIYFIAGFKAAQDAGFGTDTTAGATTGTDTELGTDTDVTADADTDAEMGTETDVTAGAVTDAETDTGADVTAGADTDTELDTGTTAGTSGGAEAGMGGFFEIPVETVMSECQNNPGMLVFDLIEQQSGAAR